MSFDLPRTKKLLSTSTGNLTADDIKYLEQLLKEIEGLNKWKEEMGVSKEEGKEEKYKVDDFLIDIHNKIKDHLQ